jgi:hypothetical protein
MDLFEIPGHAGSLRSAGVGNSIAGLPADGAIIDDRRIGNPSYSPDDLLCCRGHENPTACQRLFGAAFVRERKPLPENELRVCCPRLSVHVYGQFVAHELRGQTVSRLQEMSCVGDSRGSRFFLSGTGAGQNLQRRCALPW